MAENANTTKSVHSECYVYVYWRSDLSKETPFYVGKGKNGRCRKRSGRNPFFLKILADLDDAGLAPRLEMSGMMTEAEAFALEVELIEFYGRADRGEGPLVNLTRGGEGLKDVAISDDLRRKAARQMDALKLRPEVETRRLQGLRKAARRQEVRAARSQAQNARYADKQERIRHGALMKDAWAHGDFRDKHSAALSASWNDEDIRKRRIDGIRKSLADGGAERRSKTLKEQFAGPSGAERRARISSDSAARWQDPNFQKRRQAKMFLMWERRHIAAGRPAKAQDCRRKADDLMASLER